jgi:hypothetical protein
MSDDATRLQRHIQALGVANRRLAAQIEIAARHRRATLADEWVADLAAADQSGPVRLVKHPDGTVFAVEGERRRAVRSGLLAAALERLLGAVEPVKARDLDTLAEGPPVEVLEAPHGAPFVILGGERLPVRGLPLPHPLADVDHAAFPEGQQLDLGATAPVAPSAARARELPLPDFLIIGAQKSATRWLRTNLDAHPDIFTAPGEPGFFNDERRRKQGGLDWYREQFTGWDGEPFVGESTPGYLMWAEGPEEVAGHIERLLPDVRLLAVLRNPADRARSAMIHHMVKGRLPADSDLLSLVRRTPPEEDQLGLISGGWYAASLAPYVDRFGDRVLVLLHDDVRADPAAAYARAVGHIGAEQRALPTGLSRVRESQEALLPGVPRLTVADREELWVHFQEDVSRLEDLLGRDLSAWHPDAYTDEPDEVDDAAETSGADGDDTTTDADAETDGTDTPAAPGEG